MFREQVSQDSWHFQISFSSEIREGISFEGFPWQWYFEANKGHMTGNQEQDLYVKLTN